MTTISGFGPDASVSPASGHVPSSRRPWRQPSVPAAWAEHDLGTKLDWAAEARTRFFYVAIDRCSRYVHLAIYAAET